MAILSIRNKKKIKPLMIIRWLCFPTRGSTKLTVKTDQINQPAQKAIVTYSPTNSTRTTKLNSLNVCGTRRLSEKHI